MLAIATLGAAIRRKGLLGGTMNTVLDFIPYVGGAKNLGGSRPRPRLHPRPESEVTARNHERDLPDFVF